MQTTLVSSSTPSFNNNVAIAAQIGNQTAAIGAISATARAADLAFANTQTALEQLMHKREIWEAGIYRTSTVELYTLLAECYSFYKSMEGNTEAAKEKRKALSDYCLMRGAKFHEKTHSLNRIVYCVFGVDRRRVSAYATALRRALSAQIKPQNLVDYFVNAGGIEEVRTNKTGTALPSESKAKLAEVSIQNDKLGTLHHAALAQQLDAGNIGAHTVLVGTWNADGSIDVRTVVNSKSVLKAALVSYYSAKKADQLKAASEAEKQSLEDIKRQAVDAAAAEALFSNEAVMA